MIQDTFGRHPVLWFDDGSVVLVAENTGFRVHRSLLARHSDVFRDMFSVAQPETPLDDKADGCPIVPLLNDRAEDVATILDILYDGGQNFYAEGVQIQSSTAIAALTLGTKYGFDTIRREALRRISLCYPKDVTAIRKHETCHPSCTIGWNPVDSITIYHLACRLGLDVLILPALYKCATTLSTSQIVSAAMKADDALSLHELAVCIECREELQAGYVGLYRAFVDWPQSPGCTQPRDTENQTKCYKSTQIMIAECVRMHLVSYSAFRDFGSWIEGWEENSYLCQACASYFTKKVEEGQAELWSSLHEKYCITPRRDTIIDEAEN